MAKGKGDKCNQATCGVRLKHITPFESLPQSSRHSSRHTIMGESEDRTSLLNLAFMRRVERNDRCT